MASLCKNLLVVLSLCLLLHQLSSAYVAHLSHDKHSKKTHNKKQHGEKIHHKANQRSANAVGKVVGSFLKKGWKLFGDDDVINVIEYAAGVSSKLAKVSTFGVQIEKIIHGCENLAPDMKRDWEEHKRQLAMLRNMSSIVDDISLQAKSRQIYANTSFYEFQRTIARIEKIGYDQDRISKEYEKRNFIAPQPSDQVKKTKLADGLALQKFKISKVDFAVQLLGDFVSPKLVVGGKAVNSAGTRFEPASNLASSLYDIYTLFTTIQDCKDKGKKAKEALETTKVALQNSQEVLEKVRDANNQIQSAYNDIKAQVFNITLLDDLKTIANLMKDSSLVKQTSDNEATVAALNNYISGEAINTDIDDNKVKIDNRQREANEALQKVSYTIECHLKKAFAVNDMREECLKGINSLRGLYDIRQKSLENDMPACNARIGQLLDPFDGIKATWEEWVKNNQKGNPICLMNNEDLVEDILGELQLGKTELEEIAATIPMTGNGINEELQAIIDKLKDDPRAKQLHKDIVSNICRLKEIPGMNTDMAIKVLSATFPKRPVSKGEYEKQAC